MPIRVHREPSWDERTAGAPGVEDPLRRLLDLVRAVAAARGPAAPGTRAVVRAGLDMAGTRGRFAEGVVRVRNAQLAATVVRAGLTVLVAADGSTWAPEAYLHVRRPLLLPGEATEIDLAVMVDDAAVRDRYAGEVVLHGVAQRIPVTLAVEPGARGGPP